MFLKVKDKRGLDAAERRSSKSRCHWNRRNERWLEPERFLAHRSSPTLLPHSYPPSHRLLFLESLVLQSLVFHPVLQPCPACGRQTPYFFIGSFDISLTSCCVYDNTKRIYCVVWTSASGALCSSLSELLIDECQAVADPCYSFNIKNTDTFESRKLHKHVFPAGFFVCANGSKTEIMDTTSPFFRP